MKRTQTFVSLQHIEQARGFRGRQRGDALLLAAVAVGFQVPLDGEPLVPFPGVGRAGLRRRCRGRGVAGGGVDGAARDEAGGHCPLSLVPVPQIPFPLFPLLGWREMKRSAGLPACLLMGDAGYPGVRPGSQA